MILLSIPIVLFIIGTIIIGYLIYKKQKKFIPRLKRRKYIPCPFGTDKKLLSCKQLGYCYAPEENIMYSTYCDPKEDNCMNGTGKTDGKTPIILANVKLWERMKTYDPRCHDISPNIQEAILNSF
jgi:hypothetical protein